MMELDRDGGAWSSVGHGDDGGILVGDGGNNCSNCGVVVVVVTTLE